MATTLVPTLCPMVTTVKLTACTLLFLFHLIWPCTDLTTSSFSQSCPGPLFTEPAIFDSGKWSFCFFSDLLLIDLIWLLDYHDQCPPNFSSPPWNETSALYGLFMFTLKHISSLTMSYRWTPRRRSVLMAMRWQYWLWPFVFFSSWVGFYGVLFFSHFILAALGS